MRNHEATSFSDTDKQDTIKYEPSNQDQISTSENNAETEESEEQYENRMAKLGRKLVGFASRFLSRNGEKARSKNYLLMEHMPADHKKALGDTYKAWDKSGIDMPAEIGEMLEGYVNNPDIWFGVHRSSAINGQAFENDKDLQAIMRDGLQNAGDASSGFLRTNPPVSKTVSKCDNMLNATILTKSSYKGSTGSVLVAIPKKYLDEDGTVKPEFVDTVYDSPKEQADGSTRHDNGATDPVSYIRPEFLVGFVQNLGKGNSLQFKSRDEILAAAEKDKE